MHMPPIPKDGSATSAHSLTCWRSGATSSPKPPPRLGHRGVERVEQGRPIKAGIVLNRPPRHDKRHGKAPQLTPLTRGFTELRPEAFFEEHHQRRGITVRAR